MSKGRTNGAKSLNVLFIGNSFTSRHDVPGLVETLAAADGRELRHKLLSIGGASLRTHWNKGEAAREIARGGYDYVVLQEQSTLPVKNPQRMLENVLLFDEAIQAAKSRTALYLTWARRHAPETQRSITRAYETAAKQTGAVLIAAGVAWQQFRRLHHEPELYDRDGSHPTLAGSFLAACVVFVTLFGRRPPNAATLDGLAAGELNTLSEAAVNAAAAP
jgi:hypothetical protein